MTFSLIGTMPQGRPAKCNSVAIMMVVDYDDNDMNMMMLKMVLITTFEVPPSGSRPKCRPDASQCGGNLLLTRHLLTQFLACISQARPQGLLKGQGLPRLGDLLRQQGLFTLQGKLFLLAVPLLLLKDGCFYLLQSGFSPPPPPHCKCQLVIDS